MSYLLELASVREQEVGANRLRALLCDLAFQALDTASKLHQLVPKKIKGVGFGHRGMENIVSAGK